jgi:hypothetical protein
VSCATAFGCVIEAGHFMCGCRVGSAIGVS